MAAFEYRALDAAGKRRRGVISAESARLARSELRRRGLTLLALDRAARPSGSVDAARGQRLDRTQRLILTRQLATMIGAGATISEALAAIAAEARKPVLRTLVLGIRADVVGGLALSQALARHPRAFPRLHVALIAAGEKAGALADVLARLTAHLESEARTSRKLMTALAYPLTLAMVASGVVIALMLFVVPKVVEQFADFGGQLPLLTRIMIAISGSIAQVGPWIVLLLAAAVGAGVVALRQDRHRQACDRLLLRLPLAGKAVRAVAALHLARVLAMLTGAGIPVTDALAAAQRAVGNRAIAERLAGVLAEVREGGGLAAALERADILPPMVVTMAALGERSGRLPEMLDKAADHLEEALDGVTTTLLTLLEPAIIVVMGGIVASIVLAILLPILKLNTLAF